MLITHVIDIKLDNIQNTLPDEETAILTRFVNAEREEPGPRKILDEARTIYTSRPLEYGDIITFPILSDLGMCVFGQEKYEGIIQPVPYRAPEIILRMKWNCSVDIWNLGVLVGGSSTPVDPVALNYPNSYVDFIRSGSFSSLSIFLGAIMKMTVLL